MTKLDLQKIRLFFAAVEERLNSPDYSATQEAMDMRILSEMRTRLKASVKAKRFTVIAGGAS